MEDIYTEVANLYSILLDIYQGKQAAAVARIPKLEKDSPCGEKVQGKKKKSTTSLMAIDSKSKRK